MPQPVPTGPLDLVLLDMDGVLVDSRHAIARSVNHALRAVGVPPVAEAVVHAEIGTPLGTIFEGLLGKRANEWGLVHSCIEAYRARYTRLAGVETTVFPEVPDALADLARDHRLAVATTKPTEYARPILEQLGLGRFFEDVVGAVLAPDGMEPKTTTVGRALQRLGRVAPVGAAAMVGDRHHDVEAGRAHGLLTIGVTWGAGSVEELRGAGAARLVDGPRDLPAAIRRAGSPAPPDCN